jgi:ABC-type branched-subunit amino acid transport system substrate-binding protein
MIFRRRRAGAHAVSTLAISLLTLCMFAASCTSSDIDESGASRSASTGDEVVSPGPVTAGNAGVAGMRGVTPGVKVSADFRQRIASVDPELKSLAGAAEAYDATVLAALAAEKAKSDSPGRIAEYLTEQSVKGTRCFSFKICQVTLAGDSGDVDYDGVTGSIDLQTNGDPGTASFGIVEFNDTGALRLRGSTQANAAPAEAVAVSLPPNFGPKPDGVLTIGMLLPVNGPNGDIARAAQAGVKLAVEEINKGVGVVGAEVELLPDESGDGSPDSIRTASQRLIDSHADVVIGGTTYDIDAVAVPLLTGAGLVMISPSDTARVLSAAEDGGRYFRLAPPNDLEGQALGTLIANDGFTKVLAVTATDDESRNLTNDVGAALNALSASLTNTLELAPGTDLTALATIIADTPAQAVVIVAPTDQTAAMVKALITVGRGPRSFPVFGSATAMNATLAQDVGAS